MVGNDSDGGDGQMFKGWCVERWEPLCGATGSMNLEVNFQDESFELWEALYYPSECVCVQHASCRPWAYSQLGDSARERGGLRKKPDELGFLDVWCLREVNGPERKSVLRTDLKGREVDELPEIKGIQSGIRLVFALDDQVERSNPRHELGLLPEASREETCDHGPH